MNASISANRVRELPTRELALELLRTLSNPSDRQVYAQDVVLVARQNYARAGEPDLEHLAQKVSDAWAWLVGHALVGPHPKQQGPYGLTSAGRELAADANALTRVFGEERLSGPLDPALDRARSIFSLGDYEAACSAALKAVEVEVRRAACLPTKQIGAPLMRAAFQPDEKGATPGALTDTQTDVGEQKGVADLFAGAMGALRNPLAHRPVDFEDPIEAAEVIQLADLLLRVVRRAQKRGAA